MVGLSDISKIYELALQDILGSSSSAITILPLEGPAVKLDNQT